MFNLLGIVIFIATLALFVIGLLALIRDPKRSENRWFASLAFLLGIWMPANFLGSNLVNSEWTDFFLKVDLTTGIFAAFALMMFVDTLTLKFSSKNIRSNQLPSVGVVGGMIVNVALLVLVFGGYMVSSWIGVDGYLDIEYTNSYYAYIAVIVFYFAHALINLGYKKRHAANEDKGAIRLIFNGFLVAIVANLLTNVVSPLVIEDTATVKAFNIVGYIGLMAMILLIYVAITTKKLFDVRLIVARAVAYTLLLATLIGLYSLAVFGLANNLLGTDSVFAQQVVPIISAIFLVFTAPFFKRLFDKITNKLFYQDAYDPQTLLDDLNKVLLGNIELSILLRHASMVIQQHLKNEMCLVAVSQVPSAPMRIVGTMDPHLSEEEMNILRNDLAKQETKITSVEDIPVHGRLSRLLKAKNIALVVRLQTSHNAEGIALAYLILGPKRSGNIYNKQDFRIVEIIADEMVIAIQNALRFEEIQGFAATLQERVNEATAKLKRTNEKLKEMDETKDEFISMASHQLRTPLTSVKGYLSMVLEGDVGKVSTSQQKLLDQAFISSQRMVYLIADLLNVSRLKTGKFVITSAPTNLGDMVEGEPSQLTEVAKGKKIKVAYKKPKDLTLLMLDETKVRQVVMNFVDNAIYYTPSGGKVNVEVKEDRNNVYFTVKDNGMGIPREDQKHLFTKFYRAANARQVRPDGTGLGLFMAKKVVAAQGGTILFESTEGKGSTFGFSFSKTKLKVPAAKS